jgi:8-oxo-dGTP pyrophosphatase MutT (NUDIX family)
MTTLAPEPAKGTADTQPIIPAATLVLTRQHKGRSEVLMGRRSPDVVFMPNCWVFPGGRVEPTDALAEPVGDLPAATLQALAGKRGQPSPQHLALTAIRETFEETGERIGASSAWAPPPCPVWQRFAEPGAAPSLEHFEPLARAITPPGQVRRFDARFFHADAEPVLLNAEPGARCGELVEVAWLPLDELTGYNLASITQWIVGAVRQRLAVGEPLRPDAIAFFDGQHLRGHHPAS